MEHRVFQLNLLIFKGEKNNLKGEKNKGNVHAKRNALEWTKELASVIEFHA